MRGKDEQQLDMFSYVNPEQRVPQEHPLRSLRAMTDEALPDLQPRFNKLYAKTGRPSIAPEKLLRALLLQALYSVRSERMLMEQLDYNLLFRPQHLNLTAIPLIRPIPAFLRRAAGAVTSCNRPRSPPSPLASESAWSGCPPLRAPSSQGALDEGIGMNLPRARVSMIVFFMVAFGIPWTTWIVLRMKHVAFPEGTLAFTLSTAFCSAGGVVATYIANGRSGLKELAHRCVLYRVPVAWWLYALFLAPAVHAVATVIYGTAHGRVGPVRPMERFHQWWLFYMFLFILFQGPLAEELAWRGFLLPRLLGKCSPLRASMILGVVWAAWHINVFFSPISTWALFTASAVALSILMTVLFLHTHGSVLLAIVMHWSVIPGKHIVRTLFPVSQEPPDWLRAAVVITVSVIMVAIMGRKLSAAAPHNPNTAALS
jgi:membrane protease YdiL (CAAX protease family)